MDASSSNSASRGSAPRNGRISTVTPGRLVGVRREVVQQQERQAQVQADRVLAIRLWTQEHDAYMTAIADRRLALELADEENRDEYEGLGLQLREDTDGDTDGGINGDSGSDTDSGTNSDSDGDADIGQLTTAAGNWRDSLDDHELQQPDQTNNGDERKQSGQALCCVCDEWEPLDVTLTLDCNHTYCSSCLACFIRGCIDDSSRFPPQCCNMPIAIENCRGLLSDEHIDEFYLKQEELSTRNPTHCSSCGKFIRPRYILNQVATCGFCNAETCSACKGPVHAGLCEEDGNVRLLRDLARQNGWRQCGRCRNMVELVTGCYHITCRCTYQFCYLCGMEWKTCDCRQFEDDAGHNPDYPEGGPGRVPYMPDWDVMDEPPLPPPCERHRFARRVNGAPCATCGADWLPWVNECIYCGERRCRMCTQNLRRLAEQRARERLDAGNVAPPAAPDDVGRE